MRYIETGFYRLEIGPIEESGLGKLLSTNYGGSKKLILVDENSHEHCLPLLMNNFDQFSSAEIIQIPSGEDHKQLEIATQVWEALTDYGVNRNDLIINLGGGMITDLGGFVASCYKRGIDFINIPTTLLGMIDASIGGKTGLNLGNIKNQIGVFSNPVALYIDPAFLETLPESEFLGGFAEMLKHGLISDRKLFDRVLKQMHDLSTLDEELIVDCINVKNEIVQRDPKEKNERKKLNFGHTLGHAIEGHYVNKFNVNHGYCVAIGMLMESYISYKKGMIGLNDFQLISEAILEFYELPKFSDEDIHEILSLLHNDKKNRDGKIMCCLLDGIGNCTIDHSISEAEFLETLMHYRNLQIGLN